MKIEAVTGRLYPEICQRKARREKKKGGGGKKKKGKINLLPWQFKNTSNRKNKISFSAFNPRGIKMCCFYSIFVALSSKSQPCR